MKKPDNQTTISIILAIGLMFTICYVAFDKYDSAQKAAYDDAYQDGFAQGYNFAILDIAQKTAAGQQIPLILGNQTIYIISVETCLNALQGGN